MSHAPSDTLRARHEALRKTLTVRGLDALVVTARPNVLYLTNFTGSTGIVVITPDRLTFVTDSRYVESLADTRGRPHECPQLEIAVVEDSYDQTLAELLSSDSAARVGVEAEHLSVSRFDWLKATLSGGRAIELISTEHLVEGQRVVKDAYELATIREAASRLSTAARRVLTDVRSGITEREFSHTIDLRVREAGFERLRLIRLWPAGQTRRCLTPDLAGEQ